MLVGAGAARGVFVGIFKVKDFFVRVFLGVLSISYVSQANILQIASVHLPYLLTHPRTPMYVSSWVAPMKFIWT